MDQQHENEARILEAWKAHYSGQNQEAIQKFLQVINDDPENLDAQWGLGLSYRNAHEHENAIQTFQKVLDLASARLQGDEVDQAEVERHVMLKRMASQQIQFMDQFLDK